MLRCVFTADCGPPNCCTARWGFRFPGCSGRMQTCCSLQADTYRQALVVLLLPRGVSAAASAAWCIPPLVFVSGVQAAFVYIDGYRHAAATPEGFLGSAAGSSTWAALQRHFPVQQEQRELLLAAAAALLKALPSFLQGLLLALQHRQQQILLHGFCSSSCGVSARHQLAKTQQQQQQQEEWAAAAAGHGSSSLSPEEQMDLLLEAISLCCSQQLWPQQQEKLRCCNACIQWMQREFTVS